MAQQRQPSIPYKPIKLDGTEIRLLRLLKGNGDTVRCELFPATLHGTNSVLQYTGLSYTWGSPNSIATIEINGTKWKIRRNLWQALYALRREDEHLVLWVDAVCINQNVIAERNQQITLMADIYRTAGQVFIYLGKGSHATSQAMATMRTAWNLGTSLIEVSFTGDSKNGLNDLLKRPWFERVWILQEAFYARSATIFCGSHSVSSIALEQAARSPGIKLSSHCESVLDLMTRDPDTARKKKNLKSLIVEFRHSKASDQRDMLYALLSMSSDAHSVHDFRPDYNKSLSEVIYDFIIFEINYDRNIGKIEMFEHWTIEKLYDNMHNLPELAMCWALDTASLDIVTELFRCHVIGEDWEDDMLKRILRVSIDNRSMDLIKRLLQRYYQEFHPRESNWPRIAMNWARRASNAEIIHELLEFCKGRGDETLDWKPLLRNAIEWTIETDEVNGLKDILKKYDISEILGIIYSETFSPKPELLAAKFGDMELLELISSQRKECFCSHSEAIEVAYENGHEDIVIFLFNRGGSVTPDIFCRILEFAINESCSSLQQFLLSRWNSLLQWWQSKESDILRIIDYGVDIDLQNSRGETPLMRAACCGLERTLRLLLKRKARIDIQDDNGVTVVLQVVSEIECLCKQISTYLGYRFPRYSHEEMRIEAQKRILDILIFHKADLNIADNKGSLPLHTAIGWQERAVVKGLRHDADVNIKLHSSSTALSFDAERYLQLVVETLLDHDADVNVKDKEDLTPLWHACKAGHLGIVALLLAHGADTEARNCEKMTPLNWAANNGLQHVLKILLKHRPDVNTRDTHMRTPLMCAAYWGHACIVDLLLQHEAAIDLEDEKKMPAIFYAAYNNHEMVVRALLNCGATFDSADAHGKTPLDYATSRGCYGVRRLLEHTDRKRKQNA